MACARMIQNQDQDGGVLMKGVSLRKSQTKSAALVSITKFGRRCATLLAMLGFASALWTMSATAASFPCEKAATKVEKLICADAALSSLDEELAASYRHDIALKHGMNFTARKEK